MSSSLPWAPQLVSKLGNVLEKKQGEEGSMGVGLHFQNRWSEEVSRGSRSPSLSQLQPQVLNSAQSQGRGTQGLEVREPGSHSHPCCPQGGVCQQGLHPRKGWRRGPQPKIAWEFSTGPACPPIRFSESRQAPGSGLPHPSPQPTHLPGDSRQPADPLLTPTSCPENPTTVSRVISLGPKSQVLTPGRGALAAVLSHLYFSEREFAVYFPRPHSW